MGTLSILFVLSVQLAPVLGLLMLSISAIVGEDTASRFHQAQMSVK